MSRQRNQPRPVHPLTVAGAAQVRLARAGVSLLLPVELRRANHTASTNMDDCNDAAFANPTMTDQPHPTLMSNSSQIDQIAERVEHLLLRYEELQRTNALLAQQVDLLTHERDSLKSRLSAARARVDALLERLPEITETAPSKAQS